MNTIRTAACVAACLMTGAAWAQSANKPLNLQVPPADVPAVAGTTGATGARSTVQPGHDVHRNPTSAPGVYYGDTSGRIYGTAARTATAPHCDDATYNQPQTHGSISMGVMGGNHASGSYQAGTVNITKNLGTCEHPTGAVGLSISVGQGRFNGRHW